MKKLIDWLNDNEGAVIFMLVILEAIYLLTHLNK
jgi:hypothetical protein